MKHYCVHTSGYRHAKGVVTRLLRISSELSPEGLVQCELVPICLNLEVELALPSSPEPTIEEIIDIEALLDLVSLPDSVPIEVECSKTQVKYKT